MKTQKEVQEKLVTLMSDLEDAERCIKGTYGNSIYRTFSDLRYAKAQISTLKWVLEDNKKWMKQSK